MEESSQNFFVRSPSYFWLVVTAVNAGNLGEYPVFLYSAFGILFPCLCTLAGSS